MSGDGDAKYYTWADTALMGLCCMLIKSFLLFKLKRYSGNKVMRENLEALIVYK